jgi:hypothetical protein
VWGWSQRKAGRDVGTERPTSAANLRASQACVDLAQSSKALSAGRPFVVSPPLHAAQARELGGTLARPGHALREEFGTNSNGLPSFHAPPGRTRVDRALVQCLVSVHGGPSALRIASGGIRSLLATSSGVGSRPIACRRCRQVRTILFKASMVSTDKLRCIFYPPPIAQIWRNPPRFRKLRAPPAAPGAPSCCRSAALPHNNRTMLVRLGFPRCEPGDFGIAFADDLRERATHEKLL